MPDGTYYSIYARIQPSMYQIKTKHKGTIRNRGTHSSNKNFSDDFLSRSLLETISKTNNYFICLWLLILIINYDEVELLKVFA